MRKIYFLFFIALSFFSKAQNAGEVVRNFGSKPGFDGPVNAIAVQSDNKIIVGGEFIDYRGIPEKCIIRLNPDGSKDTSFNTGEGFGYYVHSIVVQSDGKILVGGAFSTYQGITSNRIIRLNPDGSIDPTFNIGSGFNDVVRSIALQADGKILVGGDFTNYQGVNEYKLIRLNTDGSKDDSFVTGTGFSGTAISYGVRSIVVQTDGKVVVGGNFTTYKGLSQKSIIRLNVDGSKDISFAIGTGFNDGVYSIALQTDGKLVVGGAFTSYRGVAENRIIRLNSDGVKDTTFITGTGFVNNVYSIVLQADGKLILGGDFTYYKWMPENRIVRLNSDGNKDTTFNSGTGFDNVVRSVVMQSNGNVLVGGVFAYFKDVDENRIIRLNSDGSKETSFDFATGFNRTVYAIATQADDKILAGGVFTTYKGSAEKYLIRLNPDGSKDNSFSTGAGFNSFVSSIVVQPDGKIIVGGSFTSYKGLTENRIIRLNPDGSKDTSFVSGTGFDGGVTAIVLQPDGKLLMKGGFSSYQGVTANWIIRLNPDGSKDASFTTGTGFNDNPDCIALQSDGKIVVGGGFLWYQGAAENKIIRLNPDGSKDNSFVVGAGFNNDVNSIALQPDGKILAGGHFTSYQGVTNNKIVRLNPDGSIDASFNSGTGFDFYVHSIAVKPDGKILIGGTFTSYQGAFMGETENRFVCLNSDGSKDTTFNAGAGFDASVEVFALQANGNVLMGGSFTTYKHSNESAYLIGLYGANVLSNENFANTNKFSLWPNPTKDVLNIGLSENNHILSVEIYDFQGKLIQEKIGSIVIDVKSLPVGLYLIKVITEEGESVKKIIKE